MALETLSYSLRKRESRVPVGEVEVESSLSSSAKALMSSSNAPEQMPPAAMNHSLDSSDDEQDNEKGGKKSSRRELPAGAVATLKAWLLSPEHFTHPYPTPQDQVMLMQKTGIDKKQLKNWFTNARRRIWKPMLKKQIEQGTLTATGAGGVAVAGVMPGLMVQAMPGAAPNAGGASDNPHSVQSMQVHYQQAVQQQQTQQQTTPSQTVSMDAFGNTIYVQQPQNMSAPDGSSAQSVPQPLQPPPPPPQQQQQHQQQPPQHQFYSNQFNQQHPPAPAPAPSNTSMMQAGAISSGSIATSSSIGSLPFMHVTGEHTLNKTDSHAVLMELFARDQDLVRQAIESARMKTTTPSGQGQQGQQQQQQQGQQQQSQGQSQHPMKIPSQSRLATVPTMNSWPHFSSISSLNNLGTMPGVKSIASLSGADLASQGNVNKMGNLAQVKSQESIGKTDSYAFLEVFFGERSSNALSTVFGVKGGDQRGIKRERDEDNDIGLSLEDESPSNMRGDSNGSNEGGGLMQSVLMPTSTTDLKDSGTLKRAYDDALAARGLLAVSRSCEKLTDLALPAKIQRTLSQELIRQHQVQPRQLQQHQQDQSQYGQYSTFDQQQQQSTEQSNGSQQQQPQQQQQSQQYPGQNPGQGASTATHQLHSYGNNSSSSNGGSFMSDPSETNASVEVPSATTCAICQQTNVDTQLRPCGHMFHERCLKPSLQIPLGPPKCPIDHIPLQSALLAVPTDEKVSSPPPTQSMSMPSWCAPTSSAAKPSGNVSENATSSNAS